MRQRQKAEVDGIVSGRWRLAGGVSWLRKGGVGTEIRESKNGSLQN